ncbi:ribosomal L7Ae/L30e/S12e/Gadd45 family protein [Candidatus Woesearchaeota archaeon]|nr:ribosomal L7Ae/L30e/S12e/Gadd45 family protein [Candidatus Woesearchaeota archaeon]
MGAIDDIKKVVKEGKIVIGTNNVLKNLKSGKLSKVFITSNCPADVKESVNHYAELAKVDVVQLKQPNSELGVVCKKPFSISLLGVKV